MASDGILSLSTTIMKSLLPTLATSLAACALVIPAQAADEEIKSEKLGVSVTTSSDWGKKEQLMLQMMNQIATGSVQFHAKAKGIPLDPKTIDAAVILMQTKQAAGEGGDNPNLILSYEKAWMPEAGTSGKAYLTLMAERMRLGKTPTELQGEITELKAGDFTFHCQDAVNTRVVGAPTKQQYLCTYLDGRYVYFVLSYNSKDDADYAAMLKVVKSFRRSAAK